MITMILSPLNSILFATLVGNYIYFKVEGMALQKQMLLFSRGLTEKDIRRMDKDKNSTYFDLSLPKTLFIKISL